MGDVFAEVDRDMFRSQAIENVKRNKDSEESVELKSACWPGKEERMNRRLINQAAFLMACDLAGKLGSGLGEEELRQMFEKSVEACRQGLEAYCLQEERMQQNLPLEERHHVRSKAV